MAEDIYEFAKNAIKKSKLVGVESYDPNHMPFPWIHGKKQIYENGAWEAWYSAPKNEVRYRVFDPRTGVIRDEQVDVIES